MPGKNSMVKMTLSERQPDATEAALQEAAHAMHRGDAANAERIAAEVLAKNSSDARAAHIYAYALTLQGRAQDAIAALERALEKNRNSVLETQLGMALRQAGRTDDALGHLGIAIDCQPPFPPAFLELGSLLLDMNRIDEAVKVLERGLALAPDLPEILVHLGAAHAARGEHGKAVDFFSKVLAMPLNEPDVVFNLANLMKNSCCFVQAAALFRRLLSIDPNDSAARIALGICQVEAGETGAGFENLSIASGAGAKTLGQTLSALAYAGHGRFWLKRKAAENFLNRTKS